MGRLFWKIFLWFWSLTLVMVFGVAWITALLIDDEGMRDEGPVLAHVMPRIREVRRALEQRGEEDAKAVLERDLGRFPHDILVLDQKGRDLLGRPAPETPIAAPAESAQPSVGPPRPVEAVSPRGQRYRLVLDPPMTFNPRTLGRHGAHPVAPVLLLRHIRRQPGMFALRLGLGLGISGLFSLLLSWYLTRPIQELREASRRLAAGELDVRVGPMMGERRDEIADLGQDFDHMAERLQTLIVAQRQLFQDISHELRSPLARVQVALGLARKKAAPEVTPELDRIEREAERLGELVGEVLTLARLDSGNLELRPEQVDLGLLLEEIRKDAAFEAAGRNCEVVLAIQGACAPKIDPELFHRAVENLVRNGVRHTFDGTLVTITLAPHPERPHWITLSVCDQGAGVPEERLADLFQPFVRVSAARERRSGGYGLGLAIARRAVELHGGEIAAENRPEGGLCVSISLPCPG